MDGRFGGKLEELLDPQWIMAAHTCMKSWGEDSLDGYEATWEQSTHTYTPESTDSETGQIRVRLETLLAKATYK